MTKGQGYKSNVLDLNIQSYIDVILSTDLTLATKLQRHQEIPMTQITVTLTGKGNSFIKFCFTACFTNLGVAPLCIHVLNCYEQ